MFTEHCVIYTPKQLTFMSSNRIRKLVLNYPKVFSHMSKGTSMQIQFLLTSERRYFFERKLSNVS